MAPLAFMASKEPPDSTGTSLGLMLAVVAYALLLILHFLGAERLIMVLSLGVLAVLEAGFAIALATANTPRRA